MALFLRAISPVGLIVFVSLFGWFYRQTPITLVLTGSPSSYPPLPSQSQMLNVIGRRPLCLCGKHFTDTISQASQLSFFKKCLFSGNCFSKLGITLHPPKITSVKHLPHMHYCVLQHVAVQDKRNRCDHLKHRKQKWLSCQHNLSQEGPEMNSVEQSRSTVISGVCLSDVYWRKTEKRSLKLRTAGVLISAPTWLFTTIFNSASGSSALQVCIGVRYLQTCTKHQHT